MRLPGTPRECGPMLELGWLSRQLDLGAPTDEGVTTIAVGTIAGSVHRSRDFDACWHPLHRRLAKLIDDIEAAQPPEIDLPIEVVRVDRAYFVRDGHKRVALARRTGREFLDARVWHARSPYAITPDALAEDVVLRTARESEFRRHSGIADAHPEARFALSDIDAYGELFDAVRAHAFEMAEAVGRLVAWPQVARDWYATVYLPTVTSAREHVGGLLEAVTDADLFLAIHRQRIAWWGTECESLDCAAQEVVTERQLAMARRHGLRALFTGHPAARPSALLLPLADFGADQVPQPLPEI
jgi:hypothetical protein